MATGQTHAKTPVRCNLLCKSSEKCSQYQYLYIAKGDGGCCASYEDKEVALYLHKPKSRQSEPPTKKCGLYTIRANLTSERKMFHRVESKLVISFPYYSSPSAVAHDRWGAGR